MRNLSAYRIAKNMFAGLGMIVTILFIFVFMTNAVGLGTLFSTLYLIKNDSLYADRFRGEAIFQGAVSGMVESLQDPYSEYLNHQQWQTILNRLNAEMGGIGVYILQQADGSLKVVEPIKGGPAERAGVKDGDILTAVDGTSIIGIGQDTALAMVRGEPGTSVTVKAFRTDDQKEHTFHLVRESIVIPSVQSEVLEYDDSSIGYIYLNQFHSKSAQEIARTLDDFAEQGVQGVALDVRNNGGGDFEAAITIADLFIEQGVIVNVVDAAGNREQKEATPGASALPLVMLVNNNSASASEVLAAALKENDRTLLVGEKTFGKGLVQTIYPLVDGGALKITTRKYLTPNAIDINEIGIMPDVEVSNADQNKDVQLEKALELLTVRLRE